MGDGGGKIGNFRGCRGSELMVHPSQPYWDREGSEHRGCDLQC